MTTGDSLSRRLACRAGWMLMGYPVQVGYRRLVATPPFGHRIYLLGTRLSDWGHRVR